MHFIDATTHKMLTCYKQNIRSPKIPFYNIYGTPTNDVISDGNLDRRVNERVVPFLYMAKIEKGGWIKTEERE